MPESTDSSNQDDATNELQLSVNDVRHPAARPVNSASCCILSYINHIEFQDKNPLLHAEIIHQESKLGGIEAINK